ncbi:hypothetical protein [Burkholderia gladioli]|uniref:hypothetical protein n=1 Tax=Burkholderia gladioli TaxID=28095 RepID=UPI00163F230A|nr:hypothetical protein [Burkholderia gladioli]
MNFLSQIRDRVRSAAAADAKCTLNVYDAKVARVRELTAEDYASVSGGIFITPGGSGPGGSGGGFRGI